MFLKSRTRENEMSIGCRTKDYEKCYNCMYSIPELNHACLIRCSLGRDILRTKDSWCESWKGINPYAILLGITNWSIKY